MTELTIYLSERAPKTIVEEQWPLLLSTPGTGLSLQVRTYGPLQEDPDFPHRSCWDKAVVYATRGVGGLGIEGAGDYVGYELETPRPDDIAAHIFYVGKEIGMSRPQCWALVQQLPTQSLSEGPSITYTDAEEPVTSEQLQSLLGDI
jgi:hypothetical protein